MLDVKNCHAISNLVEKLSTLGKDELDNKLYKELVGYAGQSEEYLQFCLEKLIQQLERNHAEIRLGAFLVIEELFRKSECFRELLLDNFHLFLELTVESNPSKLLPPPAAAAKNLKQRVLQAIQKWHSMFGKEQKRVSLGYNFIKQNLKVDFNDALKRTEAELHKEAVERQRSAKHLENKLESLKTEIDDNVEEISRVVTEMNNCFCLLIPKPDDLFGSCSPDSAPGDNSKAAGNKYLDEESSVDLREHGLSVMNAVIPIKFEPHSKILKTSDNAAIVDNLRDFYVILKNRFLPLTKNWIHTASKADDSTHFRRVMDLKEMIQFEITRFEELSLDTNSTSLENEDTNDNDSESEDDSDFEEVPEKDGFEENVVVPVSVTKKLDKHQVKDNETEKPKSWSLWNDTDNHANDPTSILATLTKLKEKASKSEACGTVKNVAKSSSEIAYESSLTDTQQKNKDCFPIEERKNKLLKVAPKLPFDIDLYHWEEENLQAPTVELGTSDGHRFWQPSSREGDTVEAPEGVASLRTRVIEFTGTFKPVKWSCRAPLSGKLCPRMDRYKCPLHGKVIARDNMGNPTQAEDIAALAAQKEKEESEKPPDWQDPEFLKDIKAATGMDLTVRPPKRGKKKKTFAEAYPHLVDIEKKKNNPRKRLEKKVLNKGSLKRVAETLDSLSYKKFKDKFGDQWNYSMNE